MRMFCTAPTLARMNRKHEHLPIRIGNQLISFERQCLLRARSFRRAAFQHTPPRACSSRGATCIRPPGWVSSPCLSKELTCVWISLRSVGLPFLSVLPLPQPGPGQYRVEKKVGVDAPSYSLGGRWGSSNRAKSPGPAYDPNYRANSDRKRDPAYTFGVRPTSGRAPMTAPGPGAYDANGKTGRSAPAFTLYGRLDKDTKAATAGPTAFNDPHFGPPPGYTFGSRVRCASLALRPAASLIGSSALLKALMRPPTAGTTSQSFL